MKVKIKKDKNNEWAMVESFRVYRYDGKGTITVTGIVDTTGRMSKPYCYKKMEYLPASQIEEEMGIEKYITAKKPFYSKLSDGFPVKVVAHIDFISGEVNMDKSYCELYTVSSRELSVDKGTLGLSRILNVSDDLHKLCEQLISMVAECKGNRENYLKSRF